VDNGPSRDSSLVVERVLFQVRQSQSGARPAGDRGNDVQLKKGGAGPGTNAPCVPSLPLAWHLVEFQDRITYKYCKRYMEAHIIAHGVTQELMELTNTERLV
jgi:hypothetical protein